MNFRAREAYCKGDAKLRVFIDGVEKGTLTLTSQTFADYPLSVSGIGSGSHQIRVEYINNTYGNKCDRNAYLDYYTITTKDTVIDSDGDGVAMAWITARAWPTRTRPTWMATVSATSATQPRMAIPSPTHRTTAPPYRTQIRKIPARMALAMPAIAHPFLRRITRATRLPERSSNLEVSS